MTSRESILRAATSVFAAKGRYGSRMELIADEADINKAMIYYIYVSKDELYREVVVRMISELTREIVGYSELMAERGAPPAETVPSIVDFLFFLFSNNAEYTGILMDAIVNGRDKGKSRTGSTVFHGYAASDKILYVSRSGFGLQFCGGRDVIS